VFYLADDAGKVPAVFMIPAQGGKVYDDTAGARLGQY